MENLAKTTKSDTATDADTEGLDKPETLENGDTVTEITPETDHDTLEAAVDAVDIPDTDMASGDATVDGHETVDVELLPAEDAVEEKGSDLIESDDNADADPLDAGADTDTLDKDDGAYDRETADDLLVDDALDAEAKDHETRMDEEPEPVAAAPVPVPQQPETQIIKGSIWPGVFGGVIAALVGFVVGRGDVIDAYLPASLQRPAIDITGLEADAAAAVAQADALGAETAALQAGAVELAAQAEAQAARLSAVEGELSAATPINVAGLEAEIAALNARLDTKIDEEIAALNDRLSAIESTPDEPGASVEAVEELQAEIAAQNEQIAELAAQAEAAENAAAGEAARILARAALARVMVAVDSGTEFAPALSDLQDVTPVTVPDALQAAAEAGVPTLTSLQDSFPDAARSGLSAARAETPEAEVSGITNFIKRQLNVRSVTPREGSDPDAVLSRAQAAVRAGDLGTALTEMEALPEAARSVMADWIEAASARQAAQDAAKELADSLNSN